MKLIFHSVIALLGLRIGIASHRSLASPPSTPTAEGWWQSLVQQPALIAGGSAGAAQGQGKVGGCVSPLITRQLQGWLPVWMG